MEATAQAGHSLARTAPEPDDSSVEFGRLLEPLLPKAYQTALYLTRDPVEAEEVVQDAAMNALRGFAGFTPDTNFRAWFLRILTNAFYQRCRSAARLRETVSFDASDDASIEVLDGSTVRYDCSDDPAQAFIRRLTDEQVRSAILALPMKLRVVATLYFLHDLKYADIADIVRCPLGTVRSRLHRARAELKRSLWLLMVDSDFAGHADEHSLRLACA